MSNLIKTIRNSFVSKLIFAVGITLLLCLSAWGYFNINYQKEKVMRSVVQGADRLTSTIILGTHYAMMHNLREDIHQIIKKIGDEQGIEHVRLYNKEGQIKFSNQNLEIGRTTKIKSEACFICHKAEPPLVNLDLSERTRIFHSPDGVRLLGIITPVYAEPGCDSTDCHAHLPDQKVLGALDVVVSLKDTDKEITDIVDYKKYRHTAYLPYEMMVVGNEVIALRGRYRIALHYPDTKMMGARGFTKIMSAPKGIKFALKAVAGKK